MKIFGINDILRSPAQDVGDPAVGVATDEDSTNEGEDSEVEDSEESDDSDEVEVDQKTANAVKLVEALDNPQTAPAILAALNAMYPNANITKSDLSDIKLQDLLKEGLGEEYAFLAEKLSPSLEKGIQSAVDKVLGPLSSQITQLREQLAGSKVEAVIDSIIEEVGQTEFDKISDKLHVNMQKYPMQQGTSMKAYMKDMIRLTSGEKSKEVNKTKIDKNARDAKRPRNGVNTERVKVGSHTPTYKESIEAAMNGKILE